MFEDQKQGENTEIKEIFLT